MQKGSGSNAIMLQVTDRYKGRSLYHVVVEKSKESGIARVAITKGCVGYGGSGRLYAERNWRLVQEVPLLIEAIGQEPRLRQLLVCLDDMRIDGLVTLEMIDAADKGKKAQAKVPAGLLAIANNLLGFFKRRVWIIYIPGCC
ncbi:DUF190 domain-containing protein [Anaerospora hongkongensis]|uniref:DUF190 domain-containing protein n=1 Tax=Anaerospora hongkongensis TaxID=244830 RepID=UPI002FDA8A22